MSDWKPLYISLILLFIIGGLIPSLITSFVDVEPDAVGGFAGGIITIVEDGVSFFTYSLDIFAFLPQELEDEVINYVAGFGYMPNWIKLFLGIIVSVGLFYTFVKLLPTT